MKTIRWLITTICFIGIIVCTGIGIRVVFYDNIPSNNAYYDGNNDYFISMNKTLKESIVVVTSSTGLGTGVIFYDGTYVVTAKHVVEDESSCTITFGEKDIVGDIVYSSEKNDLAIIKLKDVKLTPIKGIREASTLEIGELVHVVGHPHGIINTYHTGRVSGLNRTLLRKWHKISRPGRDEDGNSIKVYYMVPEFYTGIIQLDITSAPGFSGAGVFSKNAELVGLLTMGIGGTITFVQPTDILISFIKEKGVE